MVQEFGEQISACLERADQCRDAAASEADERVRQQLQTWNRSGNRSPKAISVSRGSNVSWSLALCRQRSRSCRRTFPRNRGGYFDYEKV